jgi:hypothetical protein
MPALSQKFPEGICHQGYGLPLSHVFTERERLKDECPLNPKSPTKKHTWDEFVGKKLPE